MIFGQVFPLIASLLVRGHWKVARKCVAALVRIIFVTASRRRGQTWLYLCLFLLFPPYRIGLFFCFIRGGYCRSNWRKDSYLHFARWHHHHSSLRYVLPKSAIVPLTLLYTVSSSWPRSSWMGACWMLIALSQYCMTEQLPFIEISRKGLSCQKSVTVFNISIKMERCEVQRPQNKQSEHSE